MITGNPITLGADPELFVTENGEISSAVDKIGARKDDPLPISDEGHSIQEDNVLAEFNIPPSSSKETFVHNIQYAIEALKDYFLAFDMGLSNVASANLKPELLNNPQACEFGCDPDFDAWSGQRNPKPKNDGTLRTAGGHVHIGWTEPNDKSRLLLIQAMDLYLGLPSLFLDKDNQRRLLYGKAGAFRATEYGVEYRSLSNFWIWNDNLIAWVYESVFEAIKFVNDGYYAEAAVAKAINENDKLLAASILKNYKIEIPEYVHHYV